MRLLLRALLFRALALSATTLGAVLLVTALFSSVPGDAIDALPNGPELRQQLAAEWGLEGGFSSRLSGAVGRVARLDLGASLTVAPGAAVGPLVLGAAGRSARLLFPAALLALAAGFAGAALAGAGASAPAPAWRGWLVRGAAGLAALPAVFASLAVVNGVNAAAWALLEADRVPRPEWFALPTVDHPVRTALAVVVLAGSSASLTWMLRRAGDTLRELGDRPFVTAERARGGPLLPLFARHLVVPAARLAAAQVPALLSALVVVERAFAMPGAGSLFWESCGERDWPLALGLALLAACTATAARFVADVVAVVVDPREREALA